MWDSSFVPFVSVGEAAIRETDAPSAICVNAIHSIGTNKANKGIFQKKCHGSTPVVE
jgi:hypothetical protein